MVKTMLTALVVVGLATTANAESVTKLGKKVGNALSTTGDAISADGTSAYEGSKQISTDAYNQVKASEVLGSLRNSTMAVAARIKAVLSSQAAPFQKGDVGASAKATSNVPGAVSADATSAGNGSAASVTNTKNAISDAQTVALSVKAAKATWNTAKTSVKNVSKALTGALSAGVEGTTAVGNASVQKGNKVTDAASASVTNVADALSLRNAYAAMVEMNEGEANNGRDFMLAVEYFTDLAAYQTGDASFSKEDTAQVLEFVAASL